MLIKLGLVDGSLNESVDDRGNASYTLEVKDEILPWIRAKESDLNKISEVYEKLYPGSLDGLAIPRDALIDPVANKYYMLGRWEEWLATKK